MKRIAGCFKQLIGIFGVVWFFAFVLLGCSKPENKILGKWEGTKSTDTLEFFKDGNLSLVMHGRSMGGSYKFVDEDHIKIDLGAQGDRIGNFNGPIINEISFSTRPQDPKPLLILTEPNKMTSKWVRPEVKAKARQGESDNRANEKSPQSSDADINNFTNTIGMELKLIPAGSFVMGKPDSLITAGDADAPQHRVTLTKPYYLGIYEVTQEQYEKVMGANPSRSVGSKKPVGNVSWNNAKVFCMKLSEIEKRAYRLPTEAEWEYACRAGTTTEFYWGDAFDDTFAYNLYGDKDKILSPQNVGTLKPNAWGLFDMSGNVGEWCEDWFVNRFLFSTGEQVDPKGPPEGARGVLGRVIRGGAFNVDTTGCRSSSREAGNPNKPDGDSFGTNMGAVGFRVLTVPAPGK